MESNVNMFDYLPTHKLDEVDIEYPGNDPTKGPSMFPGLIGQRFAISPKVAAKQLVDATKLLYGIVQFVRSSPTSTASIIAGRPVFYSDKVNSVVTPDVADALTVQNFAGFPISIPTTKGNIILICNWGEVDGLLKNPITKGSVALDDIVVFDFSGGVATLDILADATALNNTNSELIVGKIAEAGAAGAASRIQLAKDFTNYASIGAVA